MFRLGECDNRRRDLMTSRGCDTIGLNLKESTVDSESYSSRMAAQPTKQKLWGGRFTGKTDPL